MFAASNSGDHISTPPEGNMPPIYALSLGTRNAVPISHWSGCQVSGQVSASDSNMVVASMSSAVTIVGALWPSSPIRRRALS